MVADAFQILMRSEVKRRGAQPINPASVKKIASKAAADGISLVVIWGAQKENSKHEADSADEQALNRLKETSGKLIAAGFEPKITLLFCDSHAAEFNGIPESETDFYYRSLLGMAEARGMSIVKLSALLNAWGISSKKITAEIRRKVDLLFAKNHALRRLLVSMAKKHSRLVGGKTAEDVAKLYAAAHLLEDSYLAREFPNSIFIAYCRPETQAPLSRLPTIFYCATTKGVGDCPWYVDALQTQPATAK